MTISNDRDVVGNRADLLQLVRNDDRGDAFVAEALDQSKQVGGVFIVERGSGLIEDEKFDVLRQCLGDLDKLLLTDAEVEDGSRHIFTQPDAVKELLCGVVGLVPVDHAVLGALVAEEDVFGDGQVRRQRQFLVNDDDASMFGVVDRAEYGGLAVELDVAFEVAVRINAGEDLHKGRLSGAVLTADAVDLAASDVERHATERAHAGKLLDDVLHAEDEVRHGVPSELM